MDKIKISKVFADAELYAGKSVTVGGWARTIRDM